MRISLALKAEARKVGSAKNDADKTQRPTQSQLSTRNNVEVHVTYFGKPVAYGFVKFFQESWMIKTCTGSQEIQLWQTEGIFLYIKTKVRI